MAYFTAKRDAYTIDTSAVPSGSTINSVTVYYRIKEGPNVASPWPSVAGIAVPGLKLSGTVLEGTPVNGTTSWVDYNEVIGRPGGGSWAYSDLAGLEVTIKLQQQIGNNMACSQLYADIDYTGSASLPFSNQVTYF